MAKIVFKEDHVSECYSKGVNILDLVRKEYKDEIADRVAKDEKLRGFDVFQLAMMDAGISKHSQVKDFMTTNDNRWLFPVFIDRTLRENIDSNNLLNYVISGAPVSVSGRNVEAAYLDMVNDAANKDAARKKRVTEGAELPKATISIGNTAIGLSKFGRAVEATYETIQYCSIDVFSRTLEYIANDISGQEFENAVDVLINGDGNNNAAEVNTTAASAIATSDLLTLAMDIYDGCKAPMDTIIAPRSIFMSLSQMMIATNGGIGIIPGSMFKFPQGINNDITVIYSDSIPKAGGKEQLIGLASKFGLTKYVSEGSQLREYDKIITSQKEIGTISETVGFQKPFKKAAKLLKLA